MIFIYFDVLKYVYKVLKSLRIHSNVPMATQSNPSNMSTRSSISSIEPKRVTLVPILERGETLQMFYESRDLKKAFSVRLGSDTVYVLRMEMVYCFFDIPLTEAARIMRVSVSLAKKIRGWVHLPQWPCSMVHSGDFGLTREQIIKGRNNVISGLESECASIRATTPGVRALRVSPDEDCGYELALSIVKEARDYAALYARLVIPGVGRRRSEGAVERKRAKLADKAGVKLRLDLDAAIDTHFESEKNTVAGMDIMKCMECLENEEDADAETSESLYSLQPRQADRKTNLTHHTKLVTKVSVVTTVESEDFWPISINQELNFETLLGYYPNVDSVEGVNGVESVDDVLGLGPLAFTTSLNASLTTTLGN